METRKKDFPQKIAEGLWVLGNSYFNLYLVRGREKSALIEHGVSATVDETADQLDRLKVTPDYFIVLHPHPDHIDGLPGLRSIYPGALVVAGPGAAEFVSHPKTAQALVAEDCFMSEFLRGKGFPVGRPPLQDAPSLEGSLVKSEGDSIDLGGLTLRFLSAPGHAIGGLAIHIPELKAIIASDSLGFRFPGLSDFFPIFFTGFGDYMSTLDRLEALKPEILGLAHQGVLTGGEARDAFAQARRAAIRMRDAILAEKRGDNALIEEIFENYYRDELKMYTRENIETCCKLLIKRCREWEGRK